MFRKIVLSSVIFVASTSVVLASVELAEGAPYLGAGFGIGSRSGLNVFGGYGAKVGVQRNYYLGGELFLNSLSYSQFDHFNYGFGASFIPGLYVNPATMLYSRLGVGTFHLGKNTNLTGAQLGLGMQTSMTKNWDVRGEYTYTSNINTSQFNVGFVYKFL